MRYVLKWLLFSLAFVPLLLNFDTLFPFIFTKTLLIRSAITLFWIIFAVWYFREKKAVKELISGSLRFFKNPLYIATSIFIILMLVSTVFAVNPYKAFFGDIERGEGFLGILHFFGFFVASLLVFKKEDWATFFRFNLITGAILLIDSIGELASGEFVRAQSSIGNPTFLAGYFLFVIFAALIVYASEDRVSWKIFSFLMIFGGVVGVFLTGTRGAILGLFIGAMLSVIYFSIKGRDIKIKLLRLRTDLQKLSIGLLIIGVLGVGLFVLTSDSEIWQGIPGLSRFTSLSFQDPTLQTRLISAGVSIDAVNPKNGGVHRFLIGYGPDNFNIAYNEYYNPEYMRYESLWFDRAHNKILDVLVMNGALGFLAYAAMWFYLFRLAFVKIQKKEYAVPIIFFGSAYFVQNLFVFDQISTWIPFFAFLAFAVFVGSGTPTDKSDNERLLTFKKVTEKIIPYKLPAIALFFAFSLVAYTLVPYFQSVTFVKALQSGDARVLLDSVDSFTKPYTYAQATIRSRLMTIVSPIIGNPEAVELVNVSIALQEEFIEREPYDPRDLSLLGNVYRLKANLGEPGAYEKAIEYELRAHELSPKRQDHLYGLATLYADRGNFAKTNEYANELLSSAPSVARNKILYGTIIVREGPSRYAEAARVLNSAVHDPQVYFSGKQEAGVLRTAYELFINHFYEVRDEENFLISMEGARDFEILLEERAAPSSTGASQMRSAEFEQQISQFRSGGWDAVAF